jgi:glutamate synthase (NADPH/NADH) small chain
MNVNDILKTENQCVEEHRPACGAICPLHIDIRGIIRSLKNNDISTATKLWQSQSYFPHLIAKSCSAPCEKYCKRVEIDNSVAINNLEKYLIANGNFATVKIDPYIELKQKIAIIGGDLSGMLAAWFLCEKGFQITVFEAKDQLCKDLLEYSEITQEDIDNDLYPITNSNIEIKLNTEVGKDLPYEEIISQYDGIYICGKRNLPIEITIDPETHQSLINEKVFIGGQALHQNEKISTTLLASEGKSAGISLDRFVKGVSLTAGRKQEKPYETALYTVTKDFPQIKRVEPKNQIFSEEEMKAEIERCIDCRCMECVKQCKFLQKFNKYPKKYIRHIYNTVNLVGGGLRSGRNLVLSCTLCGLCSEICPNAIPMADVCLTSRQALIKKNELPPGHFDFPVRDMLFSNSDEFSMAKHQPNHQKSKYLFFPGCQLSATMSQYVEPIYKHLTTILDDGVGLFLGCCGAPAHWSGRLDTSEQTMAQLRKTWEEMGKPIMIVACSTCYKQFEDNFPDVQIKSLWQILAENGLPDVKINDTITEVAVHDSCTARYNDDILDNVRKILEKRNYKEIPLEYSREKTKCCGYGGLVFYGNKEVALQTINDRVKESPLPYVAYCSVCRDFLVKAGKPTWHILDIIFGQDTSETATKKGANLSEKLFNRTKLKQQLLQDIWQEDFTPQQDLPLKFSDGVMDIMEERLITSRNVSDTIKFAEETGRKLIRPSDKHFIAHYRKTLVTYWVEYTVENGYYQVYNTYCHRLQINED